MACILYVPEDRLDNFQNNRYDHHLPRQLEFDLDVHGILAGYLYSKTSLLSKKMVKEADLGACVEATETVVPLSSLVRIKQLGIILEGPFPQSLGQVECPILGVQ